MMKKTIAISIVVIAIFVTGLTPTVSAQPSITNITFSQLDWFGPNGSLAQADSLYGQMSWSYDPDPATTYYLNVNVSLTIGGSASWAIQNLPLFAVDNDDFSTRSEGTYFNLAELGLSAGTNLSQIYYNVTVDNTIRTTDPGPAVTLAAVETLERRATDVPGQSPDPCHFDPGEPEGVKLNAPPIKQNKARDVRDVQEGCSKCCAGSFARSIDWLNREHNLGMTKTAQQIYEDLIAAGVSQPGPAGEHNSTTRAKWIEKKNEYARAQTGNKIVTKVWDPGNSSFPNHPEGMVDPINGVNEVNGDFAEWLKREIKTEDVEVAYYYPGNAHIVTVLEVYTKDGDTYVKYRDDDVQGDPELGDGKGGAKYPAVKHAKIYKKNDKYHLGSDNNTIYFAVSESALPVHNDNTNLSYWNLTYAINDPATLNGHKIIVSPGTLNDNVDVNKSVIIESASGNPADTIVQASNPNDHVFNVTADNVTISGLTVTGATGDEKAGICLYGADHSVVSNNNVSSNTGYGIYVFGNDSKICNNDIKDNGNYGIKMYNSTGNEIYWNDLTDNNNSGVQGYDNRTNNHWNTTAPVNYPYGCSIYNNNTGNYWCDHTSSDSNNDGIVDSPYPLDGGAGAMDYYPLTVVWRLCGDANRNGQVNRADASLVRNHWSNPPAYPICNSWAADANCNGGINRADASLIRNHWGFGYSLNCCKD